MSDAKKAKETEPKVKKDDRKPDVPGVDVPDANGDTSMFDNNEWKEPAGTKHSDQYNTQFPNEKTVRP